VIDIDLENETKESIEKAFEDIDIVFMQGGNTFWLLTEIRRTGFDELLPTLLDAGVIYVGVSAGSCVCCPTIEMAGWKDPEIERHGIEDLTGMNLVTFLMTVHFEESMRELLHEKVGDVSYEVKVLTDDQAILVKDSAYSLVGTGKEINI
jgi:dipeptidase E